jgi:hypothetical protein
MMQGTGNREQRTGQFRSQIEAHTSRNERLKDAHSRDTHSGIFNACACIRTLAVFCSLFPVPCSLAQDVVKKPKPDGKDLSNVQRAAPGAFEPLPRTNFRFQWKADFTDKPRRMAVADVIGDGKLRLITLHEKPDAPESALLVVRKWDGKTFALEFRGEVKGKSNIMAVGRFAGGERPAVIVTEDGFWQWDGKTFVKRDAPRKLPIIGLVVQRDGEERVILQEGEAAARAYRIRPEEPNTAWLVDGKEAPKAGNISHQLLNADPKQMQKMGMPPDLSDGGLVGLWDLRGNARWIMYYTLVDRDFDVTNDPVNRNKPKFTYKSEAYQFACRDVIDTKGVPFWGTPRIDAKPLDAATKSPLDGKTGLLLLTNELPGGTTRSLLFFVLE